MKRTIWTNNDWDFENEGKVKFNDDEGNEFIVDINEFKKVIMGEDVAIKDNNDCVRYISKLIAKCIVEANNMYWYIY